jgi:hypothetical protein
MGAAGAAGASAAAAVAQAIKASGVLVRLEPDEFLKIVYRIEAPLVVSAETSFFGKTFQYLVSYKGLAFFAKSPEPLDLGGTAEVVTARRIWIPG